ncbi:E3 ubiquitin-protein ligase RAD18 isoform X1 [Girardinichthys multiradiatus]|uniref:E3 ubiquitin-protein ligase RAD18 isoform X1 n=1 Tax=Girardinichthys multiradiatus TaxID=208333 RepID=UPI001FAC4D28|nr:E3 ubiquitin-protein ligase RAD18 isoform X1 [Girardinichthys multiradiatus]
MAQHIHEDLPASLGCLKNVDALLRCPICFDFLNITMMTKCSHNFCSLCIRKFLSYKLHCPICNAQMTEQDLRNNRLLDDLVVNFQAARQQLLKANFESPPISPKTPASASKCKTPREKSQNPSSSILNHFFQKKSRTSPGKDTHQDVQCGQVQRTPSRNAKVQRSGKSQMSVVVKEEPVDPEDPSIKALMSVKQEDTALHAAAFEMAHSSSPSNEVKPVIKVECPVCSVSMVQHLVNKHLDTCLSSGEKKESLRSSQGTTMRPMAKVVYNLLSVQELKRRLKECHLSKQGSREQLIKRHQEFIHLYNSQCDSLEPKSVKEIAREVEANEKMRNQLQKTRPVMLFSKKQSEKEIDEMHSNYRMQHSSDFSRLIAQVRGRLQSTRQACAKQEVNVEKEEPQSSNSSERNHSVAVKVEDVEDDVGPSARGMELSSSPSFSDVSISSSISDIFGPESSLNLEDTVKSSFQKRTSSSSGSTAEMSPATGKRRRKT